MALPAKNDMRFELLLVFKGGGAAELSEADFLVCPKRSAGGIEELFRLPSAERVIFGAFGPKYDSGAGKVSSRSPDCGELFAFHRVSSRSDGMGNEELCTIACRSRTVRECESASVCSRVVVEYISWVYDSLESTDSACTGY